MVNPMGLALFNNSQKAFKAVNKTEPNKMKCTLFFILILQSVFESNNESIYDESHNAGNDAHTY
jgi:hypothetical protein